MSEKIKEIQSLDGEKGLSMSDIRYATEHFSSKDWNELITSLEGDIRETFQEHLESFYVVLGDKLKSGEDLSRQEVEILQLVSYLKQLHQGVRYGYEGEESERIVIDGLVGKQTRKIIEHISPGYFEQPEDSSPQLHLLENGESYYKELIEQISQADKSIDITIFLWRNDGIGKKLVHELIAAAERGVEIHITKDKLGFVFETGEQNKKSMMHSGKMSDKEMFNRELIVGKEGEEYFDTNTKENELFSRLKSFPNVQISYQEVRNDHSKYWIFDDETVVTGGFNVGDEYIERVDYGVRVKDEKVVEKFKKIRDGELSFDSSDELSFAFNVAESGEVHRNDIKGAFTELIGSAEEQIIIQMAYFGDPDITNLLIQKVLQGVNVSIIMPEEANVQDSLNKFEMNKVLDICGGYDNLGIYEYPGMVHAKLLHVDGSKTFFGSANMNTTGTQKLGETNIFINQENSEFSCDVNNELLVDIDTSKKITEQYDIDTGVTLEMEQRVGGSIDEYEKDNKLVIEKIQKNYDVYSAQFLKGLIVSGQLDSKQIAYVSENSEKLKPFINKDSVDFLYIISNGTKSEQEKLALGYIEVLRNDLSLGIKLLDKIKNGKTHAKELHDLKEQAAQATTDEELSADRKKRIVSSLEGMLAKDVADFMYLMRINYDKNRIGWSLYEGAYALVGIEYDCGGIDKKLEKNSMFGAVMKGTIDELLALTHVFAMDFDIGAILSFLKENRKMLAQDMLKSWTDILNLFSMGGSPKEQYEFGRSLMQWILLIIPVSKLSQLSKVGGSMKNLTKFRGKAGKAARSRLSNSAKVGYQLLTPTQGLDRTLHRMVTPEDEKSLSA